MYIFLISEAAKKKEMERQKALAAAKLAMLKQKREKSNEDLEAEMKNADETEKIVILRTLRSTYSLIFQFILGNICLMDCLNKIYCS